VRQVETGEDYFYLNTGSPHYVKFVDHIEDLDVFEEGRKIRYNDRFIVEGTNVNFIEKKENELFVRTYERGVEDETLSCGTGVTAAALVAALKGLSTDKHNCAIKTLGGNLNIKFDKVLENTFYNIWLEGPAVFVFKTNIEVREIPDATL
jgi:diaminopimelate epimerase